jgi:hypothetical protein
MILEQNNMEVTEIWLEFDRRAATAEKLGKPDCGAVPLVLRQFLARPERQAG